MKLSGTDAIKFCERPNPSVAAVLLHGNDASLIDECRRRLIGSALGDPIDELRLTQIDASEARRDPASIVDALRAHGFFPGRRVVVIAGATDALSKPLTLALDDTSAEDALLVVCAGSLAGRSSLRKLFESNSVAASLQVFPPHLNQLDIDKMLEVSGLTTGIESDGLNALLELSHEMDYGSFLRLIDVISISNIGLDRPVSFSDVSSLSPLGRDAELDQLVSAVAFGKTKLIGPLLRRLEASGTSPVGITIALQRHFRMLLKAAGSNLSSVRPPLWGKRRDDAVAQLRLWSEDRLESATRILFTTDSALRSSTETPDFAVTERCALRLSLMVRT